MSNLRQAAQQALEALERGETKLRWAAITALKQALAEPQTTHWEGCEAVHPECKAKTELERKSDAIQRLWKERDELLSENRTLVRQNGEWQALHAELVEALRQVEGMLKLSPHALSITRAALAKARVNSNGS